MFSEVKHGRSKSPLSSVTIAISIVLLVALLAPVSPMIGIGAANGYAQRMSDSGEFEDPHLVVVWSVSDEDAQILGGAGSETGIKRVLIIGPNARVVHLACFKDGNELGQADFQFDTPEPSLEELIRAYPPGEYRFWGRTVEGENLASIVELSYELLNPPDIHYPQDGDTNIPVEDLVVRFNAPEEAQSIRLEIEDEEEEVAIKVDLPGDASEFNVPNAWLQPGVEYVLDIKVIAENGNQTVRDIRFVTQE
jgi:hypothetical protein